MKKMQGTSGHTEKEKRNPQDPKRQKINWSSKEGKDATSLRGEITKVPDACEESNLQEARSGLVISGTNVPQRSKSSHKEGRD